MRTTEADIPRREYSGYIDKSGWGDGPWQHEPDKRQWLDPVSGLACLILRTDHLGNLCGYVGVPPEHAAYGLHYDGITDAENERSRKAFRENIRALRKAGQPDLMKWMEAHPLDRPGPVPGIGERLVNVSVHGGLTYCGEGHWQGTGPDEWERWREQKPSLEAQALVYPRGSAAQHWAACWDDYARWAETIKATAILCVDSADQPADVWWFGFDCAHAGDVSPVMAALARAFLMPEWAHVACLRYPDVYRDFSYVEGEVEALANQLADMTVTIEARE